MYLSRDEITAKYGVTEATLAYLEAGETMLDTVETTTVRGKIKYEITPKLDQYLRCANAHYMQLPDVLLPCHRAFLFVMISEANVPNALVKLRQRGLIWATYSDRALVDHWKHFVRRIPQECQAYILGQTDELNEMSTMLMGILGLHEVEEDSLVSMHKFLTNADLRVLLDGFLTVDAGLDKIKKYLQEAHRIELTLDFLREYRELCFDLALCGKQGAAHFADCAPDPKYQECVDLAVNSKSPSAVAGCLGLSALIDLRSEVDYVLQSKRKILSAHPSRRTGVIDQQNTVKDFHSMYMMVTSVEKAVEEARDNDDIMDLLKLAHNTAVNKNQISLKDLPKNQRDDYISGPIKRESAS